MISVIIPVFNVYESIEKCIESIYVQDYRNLEIILVDDGSDDGSELLCDELANKDTRIRVLHQKNQGVSEKQEMQV